MPAALSRRCLNRSWVEQAGVEGWRMSVLIARRSTHLTERIHSKRAETVMNTIVTKVWKNKAAEAQAGALNIVALFCGVGLLASLYMAILGFDVSGGVF